MRRQQILLSSVDFSPNAVSHGVRHALAGQRRTCGSAVLMVGLLGASIPAYGLQLSDLDGDNGFRMSGALSNSFSGWSVSDVGDVNGDGVDDVIIGTDDDRDGRNHVVFGRPGIGSNGSIALSDLDGSNGFELIGGGAFMGNSVSGAGDVNSDGIDDLIVGSDFSGSTGYVVFGRTDLGSSGAIDVATLDGSNGFVLIGDCDEVSRAGDLNADSVEDIVFNGSAARYVVFGNSALGSSGAVDVATLDGSNGFALSGLGSSGGVSDAGDVNGDGVDDLIVGDRHADNNGMVNTGASYVVFGATGLGNSGVIDVSALDGSNGFVVNGIADFDLVGNFVSKAGDLNGDGVGDLLIGAKDVDPDGREDAGASYVVFGRIGIGSSGAIDLSSLDGTNGFVISGIAAGDVSGYSVSDAGDVNGDGVDDIIIGAPYSDLVGSASGSSYLLFGGADIGGGGVIELSELVADGFAINGSSHQDGAGLSVSSAGDVNDDGVEDILIGAPGVGTFNNGASYVVFGGPDVGKSIRGNVIGAKPTVVACNNLTSPQQVFLEPSGTAWDCNRVDFAANTGEIVSVYLRSFDTEGDGNPDPGAVVTGMQPLFGFCENDSTAQNVPFIIYPETTWDCGQQGLQSAFGDLIHMYVVGVAN